MFGTCIAQAPSRLGPSRSGGPVVLVSPVGRGEGLRWSGGHRWIGEWRPSAGGWCDSAKGPPLARRNSPYLVDEPGVRTARDGMGAHSAQLLAPPQSPALTITRTLMSAPSSHAPTTMNATCCLPRTPAKATGVRVTVCFFETRDNDPNGPVWAGRVALRPATLAA